MGANAIPRIWDTEELQILLLLSLGMQIFLIFLAIPRKYCTSRILSLALWSFYLLADYVATLALGNLFKALYAEKNQFKALNNAGSIIINVDPIAFWSPFLLLHLGGPDTITAYAIEDNELWWRHFASLAIQVSIAIAVFALSVPSSQLWIAAIPVYVAGVVKYGERTLSLRSASTGCLIDSMIPPPDPGPEISRFANEYESCLQAGLNVEIQMKKEPPSEQTRISTANTLEGIDEEYIMRKALKLFQKFKRLAVDLNLSLSDAIESRDFFLRCSPNQAFEVIQIELSFMFDMLYTKAPIVHTTVGGLLRGISIGMIILSLIFFCRSEKNGYREADTIITYTILVAALVIEAISILLLICSDWAFIWLKARSGDNVLAKHIFSVVRHFPFLIKRRRWSNHISQYNLIRFLIREKPTTTTSWFRKTLRCLHLNETWDRFWYTNRIAVSDQLKKLIFNELMDKAMSVQNLEGALMRFNTCRGEWTLRQKGYHSLLGWSVNNVGFGESILIWHMATDLCYYADDNDRDGNEANTANKKISRDISNYMLYLLLQRPYMLNAGVEKVRLADTCAEATQYFQREQVVKEEDACRKLLKEEVTVVAIKYKGYRSQSILIHAKKVAKDLSSLSPSKRWRLVSAVWVEMLCFAAIHCKGNVHTKHLPGGGELLTHVWLLIAHLGMGEQYSREADSGTPTMIVRKFEDNFIKEAKKQV